MVQKVPASMVADDVATQAELDNVVSASSSFPPGTGLDYYGTTLPVGGWLWRDGSAVSRTTYAALFAVLGVSYGAGDGSTTFNLPDSRGRVEAGKDDMGGTAANRLNVTLTGTRASTANGVITALSSTAGLAVGMKVFGTGIGTSAVINSIDSATQVTLSVNNSATGTASIRFGVVDGATLGASGGSQVHTLAASQIPAHTHPVTDPGHTHTDNTATGGAGGLSFGVGDNGTSASATTGSSTTGITVGANTGGGYAHPIVQPTLICNKIIKT